jgi:predicted nucleic acid binding AN1-type Zn finger protein
MATLIAPCGLDCAKCDSYIATQANDQAALEKLAEKWRVEFSAPNLTVENILCDGCTGGGRVIGYCAECKIRLCAIQRGLETCAACPEYACENLTAFWQGAPQAKENLEALRK